MFVKLITRSAQFFNEKTQALFLDITLLIARLSLGGFMLYGHGWGKMMSYGEKASTFPDPLGVGNSLSMALAIFSEVFCSIAIMLGLATRIAVLQLIFTMTIAAFVVHSGDPFAIKEKALLYLFAYIPILMLGPGKISIDGVLVKKLSK